MAESALPSAQKQADAQASRIQQERADARQRPLRPEQGAHRVADRRHRHAPQHRGRRDGDDRHDEQRRHGAADARRHVGHPGRGRGGRDQHPERRSSASRRRSRIDAIPDRTFKGHVTEIGNSPIQTTGGRDRDDAGDELQGGRHPRRADARRAPRLHVHGRHHDGDAQERGGGADSGGGRARAGLRRERADRARAADRHGASARPSRRPRRRSSSPGRRARRPRASSSSATGSAEFVPIKMGIAGDKYFEVLSGLKAGDEVITGPVQLGARHGRRRPGQGRHEEERRLDLRRGPASRDMNKFFESASIALSAIWASKLRSFMTVLGNIVAVTSIIAVVSLIQGLNASVKQAILNQAGADSFNIQQYPITRSDEDFEKVREQPAHHARRTRARSGATAARHPPSWPIRRPRAASRYRDKSIDSTQVAGRHARVRQLLELRRRARPPDEPDRGRARAAGRASSAGRRPIGCSARTSTRSTRSSRSRASTSASSASARRRARCSATRRTSSRSSRSASSR